MSQPEWEAQWAKDQLALDNLQARRLERKPKNPIAGLLLLAVLVAASISFVYVSVSHADPAPGERCNNGCFPIGPNHSCINCPAPIPKPPK